MSKRIEEDEKNGREQRRDERIERYNASKEAWYREWKQRHEKEKTNKNADKAKQGPKQDEANPYEVPAGPT